MKILTYNLYEGANDTYDTLIDFVKTETPDILCLQEANAWHTQHSSRLKDFASRIGMGYFSFGDSNTEFKLATFSKFPIMTSRCITEGFWHSALQVTVQWHNKPLTIWNIHLDPRTPENRLKEVKQLVSHIKPAVHNTIITGDFNSISRDDAYPPQLLDKLIALNIHKFGTTTLSYDTMDYFKKAGFKDVAVAQKSTETTVPSNANQDYAHSVALRLDYFLASSDYINRITDLTVIKNTLTNKISDHYPVSIILR